MVKFTNIKNYKNIKMKLLWRQILIKKKDFTMNDVMSTEFFLFGFIMIKNV